MSQNSFDVTLCQLPATKGNENSSSEIRLHPTHLLLSKYERTKPFLIF